MGKKRIITRRDFMRTGSYLTVGGLVGLPLLGKNRARAAERSKVVLIRDKNALDPRGKPNGPILVQMLDEAVATLTGESDPVSAWKQFVRPGDIVGIKTNVWHRLHTPKSLESTIRKRLVNAGVREDNLDADDRGILRNPVFKRSTALINIRPLRTHHWSGLGTLLKNYIMFVPEPWQYHGNACERLGAIWRLPHVEGKTRLNILVMLTPLFHGTGPHHFSSRYTWPYCGLIVSTDPVAADATGARIIQTKRNDFFGKERPISPPPRHIAAADARFNLGKSRSEDIHLIKIGWQEDILIRS